jgi:hypothetical protein
VSGLPSISFSALQYQIKQSAMKKETLLITAQASEISFYKALINVCERCAAATVVRHKAAPGKSIHVSKNNSQQRLNRLDG